MFQNLVFISKKLIIGDLKIPGDSMYQWVICYYVTFLQSTSVMYRSSFSNLEMIISDMYDFNRY